VAAIVQVGKPCGESGSSQDREKFFPRGSWERANAKLVEQGGELPLPWKRVSLREEAERSSHAENKSRRKKASPNQAEDGVPRKPAEQRAHEEQKANAARADAALSAMEAEKQQQKLERARKEKLEAEERVTAWCKQNGFQDMHTQKNTFVGATKFPLHTAVKYNNREIISMMLLAGTQKNVKDSKMQTPRELAIKMNKDGSHNEIILRLL